MTDQNNLCFINHDFHREIVKIDRFSFFSNEHTLVINKCPKILNEAALSRSNLAKYITKKSTVRYLTPNLFYTLANTYSQPLSNSTYDLTWTIHISLTLKCKVPNLFKIKINLKEQQLCMVFPATPVFCANIDSVSIMQYLL